MKLKRGQKLCKKCQTINAARQRVCISCKTIFKLKNTPIKNEIKDWKNLQKGEVFRVINGTGPYYILKRDCSQGTQGDKIFMGAKGQYQVKEIADHGIHAWSISSGGHYYEFVYMGNNKFVEEVGIYQCAHRIVKITKRNKYGKY